MQSPHFQPVSGAPAAGLVGVAVWAEAGRVEQAEGALSHPSGIAADGACPACLPACLLVCLPQTLTMMRMSMQSRPAAAAKTGVQAAPLAAMLLLLLMRMMLRRQGAARQQQQQPQPQVQRPQQWQQVQDLPKR